MDEFFKVVYWRENYIFFVKLLYLFYWFYFFSWKCLVKVLDVLLWVIIFFLKLIDEVIIIFVLWIFNKCLFFCIKILFLKFKVRENINFEIWDGFFFGKFCIVILVKRNKNIEIFDMLKLLLFGCIVDENLLIVNFSFCWFLFFFILYFFIY